MWSTASNDVNRYFINFMHIFQELILHVLWNSTARKLRFCPHSNSDIYSVWKSHKVTYFWFWGGILDALHKFLTASKSRIFTMHWLIDRQVPRPGSIQRNEGRLLTAELRSLLYPIIRVFCEWFVNLLVRDPWITMLISDSWMWWSGVRTLF